MSSRCAEVRPGLARHGRQAGFTLLELTVVLSLGACFMLMMALSVQVHVLQLAAQTMAERYRAVSTATSRYVQIFAETLTAVPLACSVSNYRLEALPLPAVVRLGACSAVLQYKGRSTTVVNVMQPTVKELRDLGILPPGQPVNLLLPAVSRTFQLAIQDEPTRAPLLLGILLRRQCASNPCEKAVAIESLVYNLQPYRLQGGIWLFNRSDQINYLFSELGGGGVIASDATLRWDLVALRGSFRVANPVSDSRMLGAPGIVGLRSLTPVEEGTDWARRDGSSVISGHWNFSDYNILGVSDLRARRLEAEGMTLSGPAVMGSARVDQADVKNLQVDQLRLPQVNSGQPCLPSHSSLALDTSTGVLVYCHAQSQTWLKVAP